MWLKHLTWRRKWLSRCDIFNQHLFTIAGQMETGLTRLNSKRWLVFHWVYAQILASQSPRVGLPRFSTYIYFKEKLITRDVPKGYSSQNCLKTCSSLNEGWLNSDYSIYWNRVAIFLKNRLHLYVLTGDHLQEALYNDQSRAWSSVRMYTGSLYRHRTWWEKTETNAGEGKGGWNEKKAVHFLLSFSVAQGIKTLLKNLVHIFLI